MHVPQSHRNAPRPLGAPAQPFLRPYLVLEKGVFDLALVLRVAERKSQRVSAHFRRAVAFQLLQGLRFLHAQGLMHRDLSEGNVLVMEASERDQLRVVISDFGSVRARPEDLMPSASTTAQLEPLDHTTSWPVRAPEALIHCRQRLSLGDAAAPPPAYDSRVDCWAVGVIMAHMVRYCPMLYFSFTTGLRLP